MRFNILFATCTLALLQAACNRHEDVLPSQPIAVAAPTEITETKVVKVDTITIRDSAFYNYGQFEDMPFRILLPANYDSTKSYPLLLFLHGIGESGTDNEKQLLWGSSLFLQDSIRDKYASFVVFPQCPTAHYWFDSWGTETLKGLLDALVNTYKVDKQRLYIGGLSMGAYGTYAMVARNPELFDAAIAISGDGDVTKAPEMSGTRWRIFAGEADEVVPSDKSAKMAEALQRSGAAVSFTLYPEVNHGHSWIRAFSEPDLCYWLYSPSPDRPQL